MNVATAKMGTTGWANNGEMRQVSTNTEGPKLEWSAEQHIHQFGKHQIKEHRN